MDTAFLSTSFSKEASFTGRRSCEVIINVKKGQKALDVNQYLGDRSFTSSEQECILQPDTVFEITKKEFLENNKIRICLDVV